MKGFVFLAHLIMIPISAYAWDGTVSGKLGMIEVAGGNNYGFRVWLNGSPALCGNNHSWAYINKEDSNYSTYVSVLLAAKAAQQTVTIYAKPKRWQLRWLLSYWPYSSSLT